MTYRRIKTLNMYEMFEPSVKVAVCMQFIPMRAVDM